MPNEVSILFNLGAALLSTEDLDGAVACFTQILAQDPHDAYSLAQLGQAQHMRGEDRMSACARSHHSIVHPWPLTHPLAHLLTHSLTHLLVHQYCKVTSRQPLERTTKPLRSLLSTQTLPQSTTCWRVWETPCTRKQWRPTRPERYVVYVGYVGP